MSKPVKEMIVSEYHRRFESVDSAVLEVLGKLGVAPEKLDVLVGDEVRKGISGGQRKRVSIAMELVRLDACSQTEWCT
ncbi:MAG: hypothetical protein VYD99_01400 [Planctomycetota bacterium]|nr:hypothetical protein [Planctomycetota bacterium]